MTAAAPRLPRSPGPSASATPPTPDWRAALALAAAQIDGQRGADAGPDAADADADPDADASGADGAGRRPGHRLF